MLGHTHALFGLTTLVAVQTGLTRVGYEFIQPHPVGPTDLPAGLALGAGAAVIGALLPDLDAADSTIQRDLGWLGLLPKAGLTLLGVKHRGVLHSGLATALVFTLAGLSGWWWGYPDVGLALGLGYFSHVALADAMTISGVPLFWPGKRRFHVLPRRLRVRTGGPVETLVFWLGAGLLLWLLTGRGMDLRPLLPGS